MTGAASLTSRQATILACLAEGKNAKAIAFENDFSRYVVHHEIAFAREKLDAANATQAVAKAIFEGAIGRGKDGHVHVLLEQADASSATAA